MPVNIIFNNMKKSPPLFIEELLKKEFSSLKIRVEFFKKKGDFKAYF